jgi:hypothetical protein
VGDHADQIDRHKVLERAGHGVQHLDRSRRGSPPAPPQGAPVLAPAHRRSFTDAPTASPVRTRRITRRSAAGTGSRLDRARSLRSSSMCASLRVRSLLHVTPVRGPRPRGAIRLLAITPSRTHHSIRGSLGSATGGARSGNSDAHHVPDPATERVAARVPPRDVANRKSRPDATHQSAVADHDVPRRRRSWDDPWCSAPSATFGLQQHASSSSLWFCNDDGDSFGAVEAKRASQEPSSGRPVGGRAARSLHRGERKKTAGASCASSRLESCRGWDCFLSSGRRYSDRRALVAHSEDASSVARPEWR